MNKTIYNSEGTNRTINPRNGSDQFVDLVNNQSISGIKTFNQSVIMNSDCTINGFIYSNNIKSRTYIDYQNQILTDSRIINSSISSIDLITEYFGIAHPSQLPLTIVGSKYFFIKSFSNGNFTMNINNIAAIILNTDWATTTIFSDFNWNLKALIATSLSTGTGNITGYNITGTNSILTNILNAYSGGIITTNGNLYIKSTTNQNRIEFYPNVVSGEIVIFRPTAAGTAYWYFATDNNFGFYTGSSYPFYVNGTTGNITTQGTVNITGTTTCKNTNWITSSGLIRVKILPTSSSGDIFMIFRSDETNILNGYWYWNNSGNSGYIHNGIVMYEFVGLTGNITTQGTLNITGTTTCKNMNGITSSGVNRVKMLPTSSSGDIFMIFRTGDNNYANGFWYWNNDGNSGYINNGNVMYEFIGATGNIFTLGTINSGSISGTSITGTSLSLTGCTISNIGDTKFLKSAGISRVTILPSSTSGDIFQIFKTGDTTSGNGYWYFNNGGDFGYFANGAWSFNNSGQLSCASITSTGAINSGGITCSSLTATATIQTTSNIIAGNGLTVNNGNMLANNGLTVNNGDIDNYGNIEMLITALVRSGLIYTNNIYPYSGTNINFPANISNVGTINSGAITASSLDTGFGSVNCQNIGVNDTVSSINVITDNLNCPALSIIESSSKFNFNNASGLEQILLNPLSSATNRIQIYGATAHDKYLYFNLSNLLALYNTTTSSNIWSINDSGAITSTSLNTGSGNITTTGAISGNTGAFTSNVTITGATLGLTISGGFSGLFCNKIESQLGGPIVSSAVFNLRSGTAVTNIVLDPLNAIRLKINGVTGTEKYLAFNYLNQLYFYDITTGLNMWILDPTGNFTTQGTLNVVGTSTCGNMNWIVSSGVNRAKMLSTSTTGDIFQLFRTGDNNLSNGYWYFNNTGNFGYSYAGTAMYEFVGATGGLNIRGDILTVLGAAIYNNIYYAASLTDGGNYKNYINMNSLFSASTIGTIELSSRYISFVNPYQTLSAASKYMFILPDAGGNFTMYINNIGSKVLQSDWANLILKTEYKFECFGAYNYIQHSQTGFICGHWSNRVGSGGNPVLNNGSTWVCLGGMENNSGTPIAAGLPNGGGGNRVFTWMIENSSGSGKALGLCCNRVDSPNSYINTASQATALQLLGYFATTRGGTSYSFTGEHSSMICDEEYNDIMNLNTDDFIGMVVCSSGKIYNLPYDCDGNTYEKQVDNIKSIDAQPMTRLSKKYKDKAVLGVISHIEKIGKNRNDLGSTSWTGCMALDIDDRRRIRLASIGEGGIWITNEYGNIENGDYITSSNIPGYATKQDDDLMHNYTIAKAVMDCEFDIEKPDDYKTKYLGDNIYASYIACSFHCG